LAAASKKLDSAMSGTNQFNGNVSKTVETIGINRKKERKKEINK
jgi:DNA-binding protein Fis